MKKRAHMVMLSVLTAGVLCLSGCAKNQTQETGAAGLSEGAEWQEADYETLRYVFERDFGGTAGVCLPAAALDDAARMELVTTQFNSITLENEMKPESLLGKVPSIGEDGFPILNYAPADAVLRRIKEYNASCTKEEKKIFVRGHVLVWHSQTPEWFFHEDYDENKPYVDADTMSARQENYIKQVLTHYHGENSEFDGLLYAWDVVNEAVNDTDGGVRADSSWFRTFMSDRYVWQAFVYANQYAPADVKLFYNDYNDTNEKKADGICKLIEKIKKNPDARIDGMGMQGHYDMVTPASASEFEDSVRKYAAAVDEIQITELDMKSSSDYDGSDVKAEYQKQAYQYKSIYDAVVRLKKEENISITNITFWGTDDGNSWLQDANNVGGAADGSRPQCPLLFDASLEKKPAFYAFVDASKLEPFIREIEAPITEDFDAGQEYKYEAEDVKVRFTPVFEADTLKVKVTVRDKTVDESDGVTVYVDKTDSRMDGGKIALASVKRSEASESVGGYEAELLLKTDGIEAFQTVGFDIRVTNGGKTASWNDTTNHQDEGSKNYGRLTAKPFAVIQKGTALVDGEMDAVFNAADVISLSVVSAESGTPETKADARVLWDENALYVYMEVKDPNPDATGAEVHEKDSVEVFVDENHDRKEGYGDDDKQYRVNYLNECSFNGPNCKKDYIESFVKETEDGYIVEAAIAFTQIKPSAGTLIGFELQVNDCKGGKRLGMLNWYDTTNTCWSKPASYGTAKLVNAPSGEE